MFRDIEKHLRAYVLIAVFGTFVGLVFAPGVAVGLAHDVARENDLRANGVRATATVVAMCPATTRPGGCDDNWWTARVEYRTDTGQRQADVVDVFHRRPSVGDDLKIWYDRRYPDQVVLADRPPLWTAVLFLAVTTLALVLGLASAAALVRRSIAARRGRPDPPSRQPPDLDSVGPLWINE